MVSANGWSRFKKIRVKMNLQDVEGMRSSDVWEVRAQAAQCRDLTLVQIEKILDESDDRESKVAADLHRDILTLAKTAKQN